MWYFKTYWEYIIVKRHFFLLLFSIVKFIGLFIIASILCYIASKIHTDQNNFSNILYIIWILLLNYGFLRVVLGLIRYYNNLIIICPKQIIIIESSLLFKDKIESLDTSKIMKLDSICDGLISNISWYGKLVIEQQNDELITFNFVPKPTEIIYLITQKKHKNKSI